MQYKIGNSYDVSRVLIGLAKLGSSVCERGPFYKGTPKIIKCHAVSAHGGMISKEAVVKGTRISTGWAIGSIEDLNNGLIKEAKPIYKRRKR